MTALALHNFAPASFDWQAVVPAAEAAAKLGLNIDSLTRRCRVDLSQRGLAFYATPPEGGQPRWFISRDFDARLLGGGFGEQYQEPDLSAYSERQRIGALQRRACVERFNRALVTEKGDVSIWLPALIASLQADFPPLRISRSQLYAWKKLYKRPADTVKLIDNRGVHKRCGDDPRAWKAFEDLYLHENQPSLEQCWQAVDELAQQNGWSWCTLKSCYAQRDQRIPPAKQLRHRQPERWRQTLRPYIAQATDAWEANERWISDHWQANLWCRWGETIIRPWLTSWMDWRTRRVMGWVLSDNPNSTTILAALRHALLDERNLGGPDEVAIDNGRDYAAWVFCGQTKRERRRRIDCRVDEPRTLGIFNALQIGAHFAIPFNANGKARLERWHRTLEAFCRTFETYCGNAPEARPDRLGFVLDNPRLIPSFELVEQRFGRFVEGHNASGDHGIDDLVEGGERLSPDEAMRRWCTTRRVLADPAALDLLLQQWHKPVPVGRNGIMLTLKGRSLSYGQFEEALTPYKALHKQNRRSVLVSYDPHDIRTIRVYDEKYRFVCLAHMNQVGGQHGDPIALEHVAELNRQRAIYDRSLKHVYEHNLTSILTPQEQLAEIAAQQATPPAAPPDALRIVPLPMDGQAKEIRRQELKTAVGAESVQRPPHLGLAVLQQLAQDHRSTTGARDEFAPDPWAQLRSQDHERNQ
ncbi:MAG: DNA-binding domain-containing protein [Bacillota bacterium]